MKNTKPKLVYFDHAPHKRSHSTQFLSEILSKDFSVTTLWDDEWNLSDEKTITKLNGYEYVVFVQILPEIQQLRKIKAKIVWVPMYDGIVWWPAIRWQLLSTVPMKIISFSSHLSELMAKWNYEIYTLKFYFDPRKFNPVKTIPNINLFFWQRANITFDIIKKYLKASDISGFILRLDQDSNYKKSGVTSEDIEKYHIQMISGDIGRDRHLKLMDECNVFIAPRYYEGIGWSFLEAMAKGMAVIAFGQPTMNEYICHGDNGYLINNKTNQPLDLSKYAQLGLQARRDSLVGFRKYQSDLAGLPGFIKSEFPEPPVKQIERDPFFKIKYILASCFSDIRFKLYLNK